MMSQYSTYSWPSLGCFWIGVALLAPVMGVGVLHAHGQVPPPPDPLSFRAPSVQIKFPDIEIEQKLGAVVPLDLAFRNEEGKLVRLRDLMDDKPVVLSLVYYECPYLCTQILNGMEIAFEAIERTIGEEYTVITVSIDPRETPALAQEKKGRYLESYGRPGAESGWHFLVGDEDSIETLATTVGYHYFYDRATDQYAHASGIMVLTPQGVVSRYFFGTEYLPRDLNFALMESSEGKVGSLIERLVLICFLYDPATGKYGFYIIGAIRLMGIAIMLALGAFWMTHYLQTRKRPDGPKAAGNGSEPDRETAR